MKRFIREPLLHFVLLGALLFAVDALRTERTPGAGDNEIVVTAGRIENLAALYAKTWQRPPTAAELRVLVDDFVLEEALYREGTALGVDQNDTIIRRRVRQKMEFVVDDIIEQVEPSEAQLEQWLTEHAASHVPPERYRFRQVYLNREHRGDRVTADAKRILQELRALPEDADPRGLGDPALFEHAFADASVQVVTAVFGEDFADRLAALPTGEWNGPVESAFGLHLVHIDGRVLGQLPPLDEVRAEVRRDWAADQRTRARKQFYDGILARYPLRIEWPADRNDANPVRQP